MGNYFFNEDILDCEVLIDNYTIFRNDRISSKGGGSCVYVHNSIRVAMCTDFSVNDCIAVKQSIIFRFHARVHKKQKWYFLFFL